MKERSTRILVLGIGNDIQQDVSIPVMLTEDLESLPRIAGVDFENLNVGGLELLEYINGYLGIVFIDTMKTEERIPGRVHVFSVDNFQETLHLSNRHDVTFKMSLEIGRKLGFKIPDKILVLGIEILEDMIIGAVLSDDLKYHYPKILSEVRKNVEEFSRKIQIRTSI